MRLVWFLLFLLFTFGNSIYAKELKGIVRSVNKNIVVIDLENGEELKLQEGFVKQRLKSPRNTNVYIYTGVELILDMQGSKIRQIRLIRVPQ